VVDGDGFERPAVPNIGSVDRRMSEEPLSFALALAFQIMGAKVIPAMDLSSFT
jgi:hypothetical protein